MTLKRLIEILGHHTDPVADPTGVESRSLALELADIVATIAHRDGGDPGEANVGHTVLRGFAVVDMEGE